MANTSITVAAHAQPVFHITTTEGPLGGHTQTLVLARTLHATLGVRSNFSTWVKDRIDQLGLMEGEDYSLEYFPELEKNPEDRGRGRPATEYTLTLDAAKHLALAERNERGRQVRQYFISVERQAHAVVDQLQQQLHTQGQQLAELRAEKAQRVLAATPRLQQALKYHHIAGLTQAEKACLMGWKTKDSWRNVLKELRTLGLIEDDRSEGRVASGHALHQRQAATQATSLQAPSPARLAAQLANAQKARAAKQVKATTEGGAA